MPAIDGIGLCLYPNPYVIWPDMDSSAHIECGPKTENEKLELELLIPENEPSLSTKYALL